MHDNFSEYFNWLAEILEVEDASEHINDEYLLLGLLVLDHPDLVVAFLYFEGVFGDFIDMQLSQLRHPLQKSAECLIHLVLRLVLLIFEKWELSCWLVRFDAYEQIVDVLGPLLKFVVRVRGSRPHDILNL